MREQLEREHAEFQKLDLSTPDPIKQRRQQEIQALYQKMEQFQMTASEDIERQRNTLMAPVISKVSDAISTIGKEKTISFIFETAMPLYIGSDVVNITADVKKSVGAKETSTTSITSQPNTSVK